MPIQARSADGVIHQFPDGTPDAAVDNAMRDYVQSQSAPKGPQPSFLDRIVGSPLGRLAHDAVAAPISGLADFAAGVMDGPASPAAALGQSPIFGPQERKPGLFGSTVGAATEGAGQAYQDSLQRNRNTPGYADARTAADARMVAGGGPGFMDQTMAPILPTAAGVAGGLLGGSLDAMNASSDAQASAQGDYAQKHPVLSTGAQMVGGMLAAPSAALGRIPAAIPKAAKTVIPSVGELKAARDAAYAKIDNSSMAVSPASVANLSAKVEADLAKRGLTADTMGNLAPKTGTAVDALKRAAKSADPISLQDLEIQRRISGIAAGALDKTDRAAARIVQDHIDDFVQNLSPTDLAGPLDQAAIDALPEARGLHARAAKAEQLQGLVQKAKDNSSYFTGSGYENSLRSEFRKLARNDRGMARFNKDEQAAIRRVASGGEWYSANNVARQVGKFAPHGGLMQAMELGAIVGLGPGALAAPVAGTLGRVAATQMTKKAAQQAIDTAALGSGLPKLAPQPAALQLPSIPANVSPYGLFGSAAALSGQRAR